MKKIKIQYFVLTAIIYFVIKQLYDDRIISNIIQSIVFAMFFVYFGGVYTRRLQKKISKVDNYLGRKVISCGLMNHVRGIIADGGAGYLLSDSLVFVPRKMNLSRKEVHIPFSEVENITGYKIRGIFDTGLKITMKSGKVEKFVVDKTRPFYKMVLDMIRK
jgi:hypothetical protein